MVIGHMERKIRRKSKIGYLTIVLLVDISQYRNVDGQLINFAELGALEEV